MRWDVVDNVLSDLWSDLGYVGRQEVNAINTLFVHFMIDSLHDEVMATPHK